MANVNKSEKLSSYWYPLCNGSFNKIYFTKIELQKIKEDKIFKKRIGRSVYWIKPLYESKNYILGNHRCHEKYIDVLKKYFKRHVPQSYICNLSMNKKKVVLIIQEHISGKKIRLHRIRWLLKKQANYSFRSALNKLLLEKGWVLDLYNYFGNFIETNQHKIVYVDSRMPIFCKKKECRYKISKKRTLKLLDSIR